MAAGLARHRPPFRVIFILVVIPLLSSLRGGARYLCPGAHRVLTDVDSGHPPPQPRIRRESCPGEREERGEDRPNVSPVPSLQNTVITTTNLLTRSTREPSSSDWAGC